MELEPVIEQIRRCMEQLHLRYATIYPNHPMPAPGLITAFAEEMTERLARDDETAVKIMRAFVDSADLLSADFWRTPLGRLMFAAGGFGPDSEMVGQSFAGGVLGFSRQRVAQLVADGRLTRAGVMVPAGQVRNMLKQRI